MSANVKNEFRKAAAPLIERIRQVNPLVHNITNEVVTNFTANGLLALGASPVMAAAVEEAVEMAGKAGALVLNMGTLTGSTVEAMLLAAQGANEAGVPVLFDPVAAGATRFRSETAQRLLNTVKVDVIRGNAAEVANLIGENWAIKGVDAGELPEGRHPAELAQRAAKHWNTVVAVTGPKDYISDGAATYEIEGGHPILTRVTGTGCLLTSVIGAYCAVEDNKLLAGAAALAGYGVAAALAAERSAEAGPGAFQIELLNELYKLSPQTFLRDAVITKIQVDEAGEIMDEQRI
ncbi:hydroxyethylthiazole kinase [Paenibacillus yonginensis]|uniref:Hydroxyethylthiazole kinase n=1 Tax=Paenibacillus yonginensis TaxID=1462996 RepID=A0A1B1MW06_9BACL|nr:hydroxyethylthiazole kinase [Paenibacillus yonginensis]ANS73356.1 hydroxyethylthiazole kinase [Paenibacillus yonginensis]